MTKGQRTTCLKLVDETIQNARDVGYVVDRDFIAFVWRIARGEVSAAQIDIWRRSLSKHEHAPAIAFSSECQQTIVDLYGRYVQLQLKLNTVAVDLSGQAHNKSAAP